MEKFFRLNRMLPSVCMVDVAQDPAAGLAYLNVKTGDKGKRASLLICLTACLTNYFLIV